MSLGLISCQTGSRSVPPPPFRSCAGGVLPEGYALPRLS
jgi:hypothetical protein